MNTHILNYNFLSSAKAEIQDLTVCIVLNGEKMSKLIGQCPMSSMRGISGKK